MLYQGLFRILNLYFPEDLEIFYSNADEYIEKNISNYLSEKSLKENELFEVVSQLKNIIISELIRFHIDEIYLKDKFQEIVIEPQKAQNVNSSLDLFKLKILPIVNEILLETLLSYIGGINNYNIIEKLENLDILSLDFIIKLNNLKEDLSNSEKVENFQKYIKLTECVCEKIYCNKNKIESALEEINDFSSKLQMKYLLYRIIDFFHLQKNIDFSHIKALLKNNIENWLIRTPIVSLTNSEIYYCGIFLAHELNVELDLDKINNFLDEIIKSIIEETYTPLVEETDSIYYFLKACEILNKKIDPRIVQKLLKEEEEMYYDMDNLKLMETSRLTVILKIYALLNVPDKLEIKHIRNILSVIKERINTDGVKQYPDGVTSSEATYYTLFIYYMRNKLRELENTKFLKNVLGKIYRNLNFLKFAKNINFDLISEIFYSCESLKLLNCIETKETLTQLSQFLFPDYVTNIVVNSKALPKNNIKYRYWKIEKVTGHTIEII